MSEKYIIGIDEGSQSAKILIFDTKGNIVCEAKHALKPYNLPRPGIVEHPDDDWWDAICELELRGGNTDEAFCKAELLG